MIEVVIAFLNSRLNQLGLFKEVKGLCEKIQHKKGEETLEFPAEWCEGNYVHIDNLFNWEEGLAYHRQTGETTEEEGDEEDSPNACDILVTRSYPMRLVCLIPKNALEKKNNNQYIDDKLATNVINTLKTLNDSTLNSSLKAETTSVEINSVQKDRYTVWEEEYTLPNGKVPGFEYAFFFVDYTISITASQKCFEDYDCDGTVIPDFCSVTVNDSNNPNSPITLNNGETYTCQVVRQIVFQFPSGGVSDITIAIDSDSEGTYASDAETLSNVDSVAYEVNSVADTLPFTLSIGDTLKVTPTITDTDEDATVKLTADAE